MTSMRLLDFLLLLLLHQGSSEEAELLFRMEGSIIELGYCFGSDYLVVYRSGPEGDQLLGNSSADNPPFTLPADLQGRIRINKDMRLLGLQISELTHTDSRMYRRECWQNSMQVSRHTQQLCVCDDEVESTEIIMNEGAEGTELLCNNPSISQEGTTVRWYREMHPSYKPTLFLDSSVSLDPLLEELQGVVEVRESGARLLLNNSLLNNNPHFYCSVIRGEKCVSFQNMFMPDRSESKNMFSSKGDRVVLKCPSDGNNQLWETPLGHLDGNSAKNEYMYLSFGDKSKDFSLVIPAASDDHSGDYSCISSTLEVQYSLAFCPRKESQEVVFTEGRDVSLDCDVGESFQSVQWYRLDPTGEQELIHDSNDQTVPVPQDLIGRLNVSKAGSSLSISDMEARDGGLYWCLVFGGPVFLEDDHEYKEDYDEDYTTEDEFGDGQDWLDTDRCIFKQVIILASNKTTSITESEPATSESEPANSEQGIGKFGIGPTAAPDVSAHGVVAGLVAGLVGLVVVGVVAAVIVIKKRKKAPLKLSDAAVQAALNPEDTKMNMEPGVTESLTHDDDNGA